MPFAPFLLSLVQPLIARVLVVLGLSLVTMQGVDFVMGQFTSAVQNAWGGMPADMLNLARLGGITEALSIIGSAVATKIFLASLKASSVFLGKNPG